MNATDFLSAFHQARASAILRTQLADAARPAMEAAIRGGFRIVEFTMDTPGALDLIAEFSARDDVLVSAGTVLTPDEATAAIDAGAVCIVSPVVDEEVIEVALARGVCCMPGTHTANEMFRAYRAGAQLQKLFPAPDTGPKYVKAIRGPMPFLNIVPTNGVHMNNAAAWLKAGAFAVGFVAPLFDPNDLANNAFDRIEGRARTLIDAVRS